MTTMTRTNGGGSHSGIGLIGAVRRPVANLIDYVRRYNDFSAAEARLQSLSDHELEDIGLSRGEIRARVWQDFDRH